MKIRHGFVSNSSSSSFCLAKCQLTKEQLNKVRDVLREVREFGESYLTEGRNFFLGRADYHYRDSRDHRLHDILVELGIPEDQFEFGD